MNQRPAQPAATTRPRKFLAEDGPYLTRRRDFAVQLGVPDLFHFVDQFGLYAGPQTLASRIMAYELVKRTIEIPGHVMEFGVWHGSNLLFMTKILRLLQPNTIKLVYGFDNFAGLPEPHQVDGDEAVAAKGRYKGNEAVLRAAIELYDLQDWVHLVVGDAVETIPKFAATSPEILVSLAWIDFDLYEPCRAAFEFLHKRLAIGGVIVLDEAVSQAWPGETVALLEFLEKTGGGYRMFANTLGRQPVMYLVREK